MQKVRRAYIGFTLIWHCGVYKKNWFNRGKH